MIHFSCPQCDSEAVSPHRRKAKKLGGTIARAYVCRNCKHTFIVVSFIARGKAALAVEEAMENEH